jgi:hypothetical protein
MRQIYQYRYYGEKSDSSAVHSQNMPIDLTMKDLASGSAFATRIPIYQLGIQAIPGTKVYINSPNVGKPIVIGKTGIFELDLNDQSVITSLRVDKASVQNIRDINYNDHENNPTTEAYLLIDIIYESEEV